MDYVFFVRKRIIALFICEIDFMEDEIKEGKEMKLLQKKEILLISLMLFSMFFGAGILYSRLFLVMKQENMCGFH